MRKFIKKKKIFKIFFINPTFKWIVIPFPFDLQFIIFSFKHFFYPNFFLASFLQFFFIKTFNYWRTIEVANHISPRNCIFDFTNNKNFFWPIWSIFFSKNVFVFWNSNMITIFKLTIFFIWIFILFSIGIRCKVN